MTRCLKTIVFYFNSTCKSVCQSTIGSLADGLVLCPTDATYWPFLASVCQSDQPSANQPLVLWQTFFNCHFDVQYRLKTVGWDSWDSTRCLKTMGFKRRFPGETEKPYINHWFFHRRNLWDSTGRLKTIGLKTIASCETRRDALKPLVRRRAPVVRQGETP